MSPQVYVLPPYLPRDLDPCSSGRAGGNRTPNLRFWRPPLCQLSYCPNPCACAQTFNGVDDAVSRRPRPLSKRPQVTTLETTPEPTVLPPSRMAKRSPCSIAIGAISSTVILMLSPGITISVPAGSSTAPVTSVVRK